MKILCQYGADLNWKNKDDFTPLSLAIKNNAWESAEILCKYGAKTNLSISFKDRRTPLHIAIQYNAW